METVGSCEKFVIIYQTIRFHNLEDHNLDCHGVIWELSCTNPSVRCTQKLNAVPWSHFAISSIITGNICSLRQSHFSNADFPSTFVMTKKKVPKDFSSSVHEGSSQDETASTQGKVKRQRTFNVLKNPCCQHREMRMVQIMWTFPHFLPDGFLFLLSTD